jgi:hypothetical protein
LGVFESFMDRQDAMVLNEKSTKRDFFA